MKNNLTLITFCILIFCSHQAIADLKNADAIVGIWLTAEKKGYIKIYKNENTIEGLVLESLNPDDANRVDINNPDPKLRMQSLRGLIILKGFNFDGDKRWTGGQVYDPNTGFTYQSNLELIDNDKLALRGYVGIPLFGRTENWTRKN